MVVHKIYCQYAQNGVAISHEARQVTKQDYYDFDYILGADNSNLENLKRGKPDDSKAKVALFGSFVDSEPEVISDPYYGGVVCDITKVHSAFNSS